MFDDDPNSGCEILRQALRARCKSNHFLVEMAAGVGAEAEALHLFMAQDARLAPAVMSKLAGRLIGADAWYDAGTDRLRHVKCR